MHRVARQIYHAINKAEKIILVPHPNPDGDALGSVAAFMEYLRRLEKTHVAYCATPAPARLHFLPHAAYLMTDARLWREFKPDLVITFDTGDLRYATIEEHLNQLIPRPLIINFDHHATNEYFGDHNLVIPTASSTTEVLHTFFTMNRIPIDSAMATGLLTGLLTDTDNFTNAATSARALAIAGDLIRRGGDARQIRSAVFQDTSLNALKLWGVALSRLTKHEASNLVYTWLAQADLKEHNLTEVEAEGIANFMNNLGEGRAALVLKELPDGKVKGSLRTTGEAVDVSLWAKALGGGGHRKAAGFTIPGPIDAVLKRVLAEIGKSGNQ